MGDWRIELGIYKKQSQGGWIGGKSMRSNALFFRIIKSGASAIGRCAFMCVHSVVLWRIDQLRSLSAVVINQSLNRHQIVFSGTAHA